MTRPRYWPLAVLLVTDALAVPLIVSRWMVASYSSVMEAAYLALGVLIVQLPLCIYGAIAARKASSRGLFRAYVAHALGTIGLFIAAELGLPRLFVPLTG
ncbi:MAG: hypothetical protein IPM18_17595 [Phycisphaerales bacterium]|nr:hypothetical protein [Phycisphaerales bacterium]